MTTKTLVLKEAKLQLPKSWRGSEILMRTERDMLVVKKILKPQELIFDETLMQSMKLLGKRLSPKTIREAVRWARKRK